MDASLQRKVRERADGFCEYCRFPEAHSELRHVVDHIIARQHGGQTTLENLALSCGRCNRHKGPNIAGIDSRTGASTRLFNPRLDIWNEHFQWNGERLNGLTNIGRATIDVLAINHPYRVAARRVLIAAGKLKLE